jgi:hypothetical protein
MSPAIQALVALVARYGPTAGRQIYEVIRSAIKDHGDPTPEDWAKLEAVAGNTIEARLSAAPQGQSH